MTELQLPVLVENMTGDDWIDICDKLKYVAANATLQLAEIFEKANGREEA